MPSQDISINELKSVLKNDLKLHSKWLELLDDSYHHDFSYKNDSNRKFYRGGRRYYRPLGWKRFSLKVRGKYENDDWLGEDENSWSVAYHGTKEMNVNSICSNGFLSSIDGAYGPGVYVSPLIDFAQAYARPATLTNGLQVLVVLQVRVNPRGITEAHIAKDVCPKGKCNPPCGIQFPYFHGTSLEWILNDAKHVRPYGICVKFTNSNTLRPKQAINNNKAVGIILQPSMNQACTSAVLPNVTAGLTASSQRAYITSSLTTRTADQGNIKQIQSMKRRASNTYFVRDLPNGKWQRRVLK